MIAATDDQGRCVFLNNYQAEFFGVDPNAAVGRTIHEMFGAESKGALAPLNPVRLHAVTAGLTYYFRQNIRLQLNGIVTDVRRYGTTEDPNPVPSSHLDGRRSWLALSQFQIWFL